MSGFYALTKNPLPQALHGADGEYSIRTLADRERILIEDFFSQKEIKVSLGPETTAIVVPQSNFINAPLEDFAIQVEFALGILAISGFVPITIAASLNVSSCREVLQRSYQEPSNSPVFPKKLVKAAASTWMHYLFDVRHKAKGNLHITADRFVRYLRQGNSRDALVDLCICLESLIESTTEISFRFACCLAKVSSQDAEAISELAGRSL
jgi:hypothetical protein